MTDRRRSATDRERSATDLENEDVTCDAVLGGRLILWQPRRGHRVGHDAILLAAATAARAGEHAVDLGAGVGAAGLALAARVPDLQVTLVEIEPQLAALAARNIADNGFADRVRVTALDVTAVGLPAASASCVLMNPPFHDAATQNVSPDAGRRLAHAGHADLLAGWLRTAARLLRPGGTVTLIWRADGLAAVLAALAHGFGGIAVLPVHPRPGTAAIRILVRAVAGSRAPLTLLPSYCLADESGHPTEAAEAVLRHGAPLPLAEAGD